MMSKLREWDVLLAEEKNAIRSNQADFPVKVGAIAKALGVVVKKSTLPAGISGEIKKDGEQYIIRVNRHDTKERQRFTLAHEIGHYLLHRDQIGDGIVDNILYRSNLSDALEVQANRIAAEILLPQHLVQKFLESDDSSKKQERIEKLSLAAEVSSQVSKIRLGY